MKRKDIFLSICLSVLIAGFAGWILLLIFGDSRRVWYVFLVNFLYFGSLSAGLVTWSAITIASRGKWVKRLHYSALSGAVFAPIMIAAGVILFSGIKYWAVWIGDAEKVQSWLSPWFMAIRQLAALLVFWIPAVIFAKKTDRNSRTFSGWIIFLYAVVFSLIGFDLVMPLEKHWVSTLFGGYFFISGLYLAAAAWCLLSILTATIDQKEQLADQGKLMLAFCMLTTYMLFSQLVVLWYENVPRETSFLVPRMNISGWHILSVVLICMVYIGPITLLLWKELKYSKIYMGIVSSVILTGMWLERWWLVMPSVDEKLSIGLSETAVTAMFAAAFGLSYSIGLRYITVKNGRKD